jgi:ASC-1-like (ASCH) protein
MTLKKKWFDLIKTGEKKVEYREIKPHWTKRLFDENGEAIKYDFIIFRNGYSKNAPKIKVEFKGVREIVLEEDIESWKKGMKVYGVDLGKILFSFFLLVQIFH